MTNLAPASRIGLPLLFLFFTYFQVSAQCPPVISSDGYQVDVTITPKAIQAPASCQYGYNYNVTYDYEITFSGSNIPPRLDILNGYFTCNNGSESDKFWFELPDEGGTGTLTTTTNPYHSADNCTTATPTSLGCTAYEVTFKGPGISEQTINCTVVLPVELGHFSATLQDEEVYLKWATWSELNNSGFEIQRAHSAELEQTGDRAWQKIGFQYGKGTTSSITLYNFVDPAPAAGITYYRLKQIDHDGQYEYSPIISIDHTTNTRKEDLTGMRVFPNPVRDQIRIQAAQAGAGMENIPYVLHNTFGQVVKTGTVSLDRTIDVRELDAGIYYLLLQGNDTNATSRVVKQ